MLAAKLNLLLIILGVVIGIISIEVLPPTHATVHDFARYDATLILSITLMCFGGYRLYKMATKDKE